MTISDNPGQKWVINESILASLTGCFRPAVDPCTAAVVAGPESVGVVCLIDKGAVGFSKLIKNFKKDVLGQPL
jgi:hypothetical protein